MESGSYINALGLIFLAALLLWITVRAYKRLLFSTTETLKRCEDLKKLLYDVRDGAHKFNENRRIATRIIEQVTVKLVSADFTQFVRTLDLSETGARFRIEKELFLDSQVSLNIYLSLFPKPIDVKGRIARVEKVSEGPDIFDTGVEFVNMSGEDKERLKETIKLSKE
ncbi:MAG: PilZ domain-containing protein [Candidatus Omnitrophota bacterium]